MKINDFDKFVGLLNKLKQLETDGWLIDNISLQYAPKQINLRIIKDDSPQKKEERTQVIHQQNENLSSSDVVEPAEDIHIKDYGHKDLIDKDYSTPKCHLCHKSNGAGMWYDLDIGNVWICSKCDRNHSFENAHKKCSLEKENEK